MDLRHHSHHLSAEKLINICGHQIACASPNGFTLWLTWCAMCATCVPLATRSMIRKQLIKESLLSFSIYFITIEDRHDLSATFPSQRYSVSHKKCVCAARRPSANTRTELSARLLRPKRRMYKYNSKTVILNFARLHIYITRNCQKHTKEIENERKVPLDGCAHSAEVFARRSSCRRCRRCCHCQSNIKLSPRRCIYIHARHLRRQQNADDETMDQSNATPAMTTTYTTNFVNETRALHPTQVHTSYTFINFKQLHETQIQTSHTPSPVARRLHGESGEF